MMLTDAQHRALSIGLRQIEQELAAIERFLGCTYHGVMVSFVEDLPELLRELRDGLGLEREDISKGRWVLGHLTPLWVVAEECQSRYLRGYGTVVAPELSGRIDPLAQQLSALLLAMQATAQARLVQASDRAAQ
jgi:hypothetical protein